MVETLASPCINPANNNQIHESWASYKGRSACKDRLTRVQVQLTPMTQNETTFSLSSGKAYHIDTSAPVGLLPTCLLSAPHCSSGPCSARHQRCRHRHYHRQHQGHHHHHHLLSVQTVPWSCSRGPAHHPAAGVEVATVTEEAIAFHGYMVIT